MWKMKLGMLCMLGFVLLIRVGDSMRPDRPQMPSVLNLNGSSEAFDMKLAFPLAGASVLATKDSAIFLWE